ncbi:MAG: AAA family ATPase [bacterium]
MQKEEILKNFDFEAYYASELPSIKVKNDKAQELCPFHDDSHPSLSIDLKTGLFHCFGCEKKGSVFDFYMAKHSVTFKEANEALAGRAGISPKPQRQVIKTYDYEDESGNLLSQAVRYEPKAFAQRRPDGKGGWVWNIEGVRRVIYDLPEVIEAQEVFIVEGEKDADNLRSLGFVATCCPGGAGKWKQEYNEYFKGKKVVVIPDNDEPGRKHGQDVANNLKKVAKSVKVVELPDLPEKGDITDWIAGGGTKEKLVELVKEATEWQPVKEKLIDKLLKWDDLLTLDIRTEWLVERLIPKNSITLLFGRGGIGKTWLTLQMGCAIAKGESFCGLSTNQTPVYFVDFENPLEVLKERGLKIGKAENFYVWHNRSSAEPPPRLDTSEWIRYGELPPGLFIIDTLRASQSADENSSKDMAVVMQRLKMLRDKGFTVLLLHHCPKGNESIFKGSTAILDLADHILGLEAIKDAETVEFDTENLYTLGTRIKTRYNSIEKLHLSLDPEKGFEKAKDPDTEKMEAIYEILKQFESPPIQKALKQKIQEELSFKDSQIRGLLKKGEGIFWDIKKGYKKSLVYIPKSVCQNVNPIYMPHSNTPNNSSDILKGENTPETLDNAGLVSLSEGIPQTDKQREDTFHKLYNETLQKIGDVDHDELQLRNPDIKKADNRLNEVWKLEDTTIEEFQSALDKWEDLITKEIEGKS